MLLQSRFAAFAASILLGVSALAVTGAAYADVDPPSRVARLSYLSGNVSFAPAGENEWADASLNRPLITGDRLWADTNSRTELQVGAAAIRLDESSGFNFLNLDDRTAQVELTQGTLNLRVSRIYGDQVYEVDTPTLAFVVSRVGEYRFDVDPNGNVTTVTVFDGGGDVYGEHGSRFSVGDHQSVRFNDNELKDYQTSDLPPPNAFDRFCMDRDNRQEHSASREFVSEEVIGASDLDDNGAWQAVPEYGHVWYPTHVSDDWAPYRDGHWAWVDPWGWTWVDSAAWGFAPFHYGRWAYVSNRWGWIPGPVDVRPVYAPALVGFIGGRGWGVGIGGVAPVGWFPLGPREVFVPGYHVGHDYFDRVNYSNSRFDHNVNITNIYNNYSSGNININQGNYAYHNSPYAVTAVPGNVFAGARPVAAANMRLDRANLERAQVASIAGIAPNRASLVAGGVAKNAPPAQAFQRQVVARTAPPAAIAPFAQRESTLQQNAGKTTAAPRYLPAAAIAGGAVAGAALVHSNVRVVPPASINAKATPIGRQTPSNAVISGQPGVPKGPATSTTQPPTRIGNTVNNAPQNALVPNRNAANPALSNRPPLTTTPQPNNVQSNQLQNKPLNTRGPITNSNNNPVSNTQVQPGNNTPNKLSDRPPNARAPVTSGNNGSPVNNGPNHTPSIGNSAAAQNAVNPRNNAVQNNNTINSPKTNPAVNTNQDRITHDRSVNTRTNAPVQNNVVAPSRTQQTIHEPINNQNVNRTPPVQPQTQLRNNAPVVQQRTAPVVTQPQPNRGGPQPKPEPKDKEHEHK